MPASRMAANQPWTVCWGRTQPAGARRATPTVRASSNHGSTCLSGGGRGHGLYGALKTPVAEAALARSSASGCNGRVFCRDRSSRRMICDSLAGRSRLSKPSSSLRYGTGSVPSVQPHRARSRTIAASSSVCSGSLSAGERRGFGGLVNTFGENLVLETGSRAIPRPIGPQTRRRGGNPGLRSCWVSAECRTWVETGGWGGIRTHDTFLTYTHFPGARLRPLGHPSCTGLDALLAEPSRAGALQ